MAKNTISAPPAAESLEDMIIIPIQGLKEVGPRRKYHLYSFTGKVVGTSKDRETHVHGGGGGGYVQGGYGSTAGVVISSTTTIHDQIFLQDKDGRERAFQLQDWNVACREGNLVTVLWAVKKGDEQGQYIVVHNHTIAQTVYAESSLDRIFEESGSPLKWAIAFGIIGTFCGALVGLLAKGEAFARIAMVIVLGIPSAILGAFLGSNDQSPNYKAIRQFKSALQYSFSRMPIT